ncbi:MAG: tRNA uracil 4-sulfurtransferase ThiI [Victivallaceae bacterium]
MYNAIICRYHEIAIKGNNRNMFERQMVDNIQYLLRVLDKLKILRIRGRIWIEKKDKSTFSSQELTVIREQLTKAFGLESFSPVIMCHPEMEELKNAVSSSCGEFCDRAFAAKPAVSFRIRAKRSDKDFPLDSKQIEIELAAVVGSKYDDKMTVDLDNADVSVYCEVRREFAFVYYESIRGPGGLPVNSNAPVLALLSGGIDSPVACYMTMKRGCRVNFITFHSAPYTPQETIDKVKRIAAVINRYQPAGKLHICNLAPIQKQIRDNCNPRFRTVLYRRMMFRIAEKVAENTKCRALVTGESLGQVASQTVANMDTINRATNMLVIRPLVGMDKLEAIRMSCQMGAFDISKEQTPDSCTVFAPDSPATSVPPHKAEEDERHLPGYDDVLNEIVANIETVVIEPDTIILT